MDTVSVVVLSDGDEHKLALTLDSLLCQNYKQTELIVVECLGPSDVPVCPMGACEQLQYLALPAGWSRGACLNAAARLIRGEYVVFLRAGAVVYPTWLSVAVRTLGVSFKPGWCYTRAGIRGREGCLPPKDWPNFKTEGEIFLDLITEWGVSLQSVVMTREQLRRLGTFDEDLTDMVEEEFLLRLALNTPAKFSHTKMVEIEPPQLHTPQALVSRCYFMSEFLVPLEQSGVGDEVLERLLGDIDDADAWEATEGYLSILAEHPMYQRCIADYQAQKYPQREIVTAETPDVSVVVDCVGCGSCQGKCPTDAISMELNGEGFLYPKVDNSLCTRCGLCLKVCPTQRELPAVPVPTACYALQAADDMRMKASSGGVFPLLAQAILEDGGYVAGAVFDPNFEVHHIVSNRPEDIRAMQTSKYVQSRTAEVYPKVEQLLQEGKVVLFTGTACQVAGLSAFLGREYDNLYTMDVVCHGVPSPGVFAHYLEEFRRRGGPITEVNFRKKELFGWQASLYIQTKSGQTNLTGQSDWYMVCFQSDWILRESCYHCQFKGMKYSDLTAADFWGIQALNPQFEDGMGSSYLTANTEKGKRLYRRIEGYLKKTKEFGRESKEVLCATNPSIRTSVAKPKFRDLFFKAWQENPAVLSDVLVRAYRMLHFDIGLVLFWGPNHGNALTNYALYKTLAKNHSVLAIDNAVTSPPGRFLTFAKENYVCSSDYFPANAPKIIEQCCSTLVVGSDQVWNRRFFQKGLKYFQLDFAGDRIRKIAYGASFGSREFLPPAEEYAPFYKRFDKIGVRERFGVDVCKKQYGVDADFVLDPVFLLDVKEYEELAERSEREEKEPFIFSYIFFPNEQFMEFRKEIQKRLGGIKIISATQANWETRDDLRHAFEFENIRKDITVEDWLYYIKHAEFIITDSFHATCFSMFFKKKFATIPHAVSDRFTTLSKLGDAGSHISTQLTEAFLTECLKPLNYDKIREELKLERERSRKWLEDALS